MKLLFRIFLISTGTVSTDKVPCEMCTTAMYCSIRCRDEHLVAHSLECCYMNLLQSFPDAGMLMQGIDQTHHRKIFWNKNNSHEKVSTYTILNARLSRNNHSCEFRELEFQISNHVIKKYLMIKCTFNLGQF